MVMETKRCTGCTHDKSLAEFYFRADRGTYSSWCKTCINASHVAWRSAHPEQARSSARRWAQANPERMRRYKRDEKLRLKQLVINAYGGVCACCSEDRLFFLSVDHVNGDGADDRKVVASPGAGFYYHLKRLGFPQDGRYQVLCFNCNLAKKNNAICPCRDPEAFYSREVTGQLALFSGEEFRARGRKEVIS